MVKKSAMEKLFAKKDFRQGYEVGYREAKKGIRSAYAGVRHKKAHKPKARKSSGVFGNWI